MLKNNYALANDPILYYLHIRLKIKPIWIALIIIFGGLLMIPWAVDSGVWEGIDYPLSKSYITWIGNIIIGLSIIFIIRYYNAIPKAFQEIIDKKIFCDATCSMQKVKNGAILLYAKSKYRYILFTSFIISFFIHLTYLCGDNLYGWTENESRNGFSYLGYYHMIYFTLMLSIVLNSFYGFYKTVRLFKKIESLVTKKEIRFNYIRLCKDNAGGIKQLGDLSLKFNNIIFALGLYSSLLVFTIMSFKHISIGNIFNDFFSVISQLHIWQFIEMLLPIPLFFLLSPLLFYYHILPLHRIMKKKKDEIISEIISYDRELIDFSPSSIRDILMDKNSLDNLFMSSELFEMVRDLSAYPFNIKAVTRVFGSTLLPLITFIKLIFSFS